MEEYPTNGPVSINREIPSPGVGARCLVIVRHRTILVPTCRPPLTGPSLVIVDWRQRTILSVPAISEYPRTLDNTLRDRGDGVEVGAGVRTFVTEGTLVRDLGFSNP